MAIYLVTYDLRQPGRSYTPVHEYLKRYTYCKGLESVWFLDTAVPAAKIRDELKTLVDANDRIFVSRLQGEWASLNLPCSDWLKAPGRSW